jgi:hypothetical protein
MYSTTGSLNCMLFDEPRYPQVAIQAILIQQRMLTCLSPRNRRSRISCPRAEWRTTTSRPRPESKADLMRRSDANPLRLSRRSDP